MPGLQGGYVVKVKCKVIWPCYSWFNNIQAYDLSNFDYSYAFPKTLSEFYSLCDQFGVNNVEVLYYNTWTGTLK
jgi:hypothetical protein